jgi:hypothetical protein
MSEFVVESYAPSEPASDAPRIDELAQVAEQLSEQGMQVRFLYATFLLEEEICFYVFESASAEAVHEAVTRACLRFERITRAVSLRPRARHGSEPHPSTEGGIECLAERWQACWCSGWACCFCLRLPRRA